MAKILLINGPNLNMLGIRESNIYGTENLKYIENLVEERCKKDNIDLIKFQSNIEGEICSIIQNNLSVNGIIINAGAYTHTSIAILDSLNVIKNVNPKVIIAEVHLSNVHQREEFRHKSYISLVANCVICGMRSSGYICATDFIINEIKNE